MKNQWNLNEMKIELVLKPPSFSILGLEGGRNDAELRPRQFSFLFQPVKVAWVKERDLAAFELRYQFKLHLKQERMNELQPAI